MRRVALKPLWHPERIAEAVRRRARRWLLRRQPLPIAPDVSGKRFLFVGGLHRSGTSALYRMLCAHPEISGLSNTGVPEDEGQLLQPLWPVARVGRFAFEPDGHMTEESEFALPETHSVLMRAWGAYFDLTKPVLAEKSPPNLIRGRFLQAIFPGASFVFIVRHPLAVSAASLKMARTSMTELMMHWTIAHKIMMDDLLELDHAVLLRYEDMVRAPALAMNRAFRFLDLEPGDAPASRASLAALGRVQDYNPHYFEQFEQQDRSGLALEQIADLIMPTMARFGYLLEPPFIEPMEETLC